MRSVRLIQGVRLIQISTGNVIWGLKCHSNEQRKRLAVLQETMTIYVYINFFIKVDQLMKVP